MALFSARTLILGGLAAGAAYALRNNPTVKGLLGGGSSAPAPAPYSPPAPAAASPVANVDVAGPPENTSTHVPVPEPAVQPVDDPAGDVLSDSPTGGIDEAAEEAAAAAEAANIGGVPEEYPSEDDPSVAVDEALRPLEEAGQGYAEGQELAEADLIDNAEVAAGDPVEGERAIEDVIEAQDDPFSGETEEATLQMGLPDEQVDDAELPPPTGDPVADVPPPPADTLPAEEKSAAVWQTDDTVEQPAVEDPDDKKLDDGTS